MNSLAMFAGLRKMLADPDLALDLGTANTRLYGRGLGMVADEPSVVQFHRENGSVEAVGSIALRNSLRRKEQTLVSPLRAGVVADVDAAAAMLAPLLKRARRYGLIKPRVLACAPTDAREDEREALIEATRRAGASAVAIAPEPMAAAIGSGLDVTSEYAQMLVDIGDGVTDIAVIRSGSLAHTSASRVACRDMIEAIQRLIAERYRATPYLSEAMRLLRKVGAGDRNISSPPLVVAGADWRTGAQRRIQASYQEIVEAIDPVIEKIVGSIGRAVNELPPELACEVIESGIHLTGGGACLRGMADLIAAATRIEVKISPNPLRAVIDGARKMLTTAAETNIWALG
ncbi:MAG TPA: rod shape-determining protein [Blastocatellia bacterium]